MLDHIIQNRAHMLGSFSNADELIKGGPGSGRKIGSTKSGKPIYDKFDHPEHKDFSAQDHKDAAIKHKELSAHHSDMHDEYSDKEAEAKDGKNWKVNSDMAKEHKRAGQEHWTEGGKHEKAASKDFSELNKADEDELEKGGGKKAVIGETRTFGGREYIKTAEGWKFHGKGTGAKAQEHKNKALDHHVAKESGISKEEFDKLHPGTKKELGDKVKHPNRGEELYEKHKKEIGTGIAAVNQRRKEDTFSVERGRFMNHANSGVSYGEDSTGDAHYLKSTLKDYTERGGGLSKDGKELRDEIEKRHGVFFTSTKFGDGDHYITGHVGSAATKARKREMIQEAEAEGKKAVAEFVKQNGEKGEFKSIKLKDATAAYYREDGQMKRVDAKNFYPGIGVSGHIDSDGQVSGMMVYINTPGGYTAPYIVGVEVGNKKIGLTAPVDTSALDKKIAKDVDTYISKHSLSGFIGRTSATLKWKKGKSEYTFSANKAGETANNYLYNWTLWKDGKVIENEMRDEVTTSDPKGWLPNRLQGHIDLPAHVLDRLSK